MYSAQQTVDRIGTVLSSRKISKKQMLSDLSMGINALSQFANGKNISYLTLARIAEYLDVSVDFLIGRTDNPDVNV